MNNKQRTPLIEEFPSQPRVQRRLKRSSQASSQVRFSEYSSLVLFEVKGEPCSKFYSSQDRRLFEEQFVRDAERMASHIQHWPQSVSNVDLCECVGLEKLVNPENAWLIDARRRKHVRDVISRQLSCSAEDLGRMSRASSRKDRDLANTLAATYIGIK
ncbi:hypothetical protein ACHAWF_013432 [Thalassiosira exigua]